MSRPRLIVIDAPHSSSSEELLAHRVARGLCQAKPPKVLVPIKNRMAGGVGPHGMQPTHLDSDKPKWEEAAAEAKAALKDGRDVVIMGPVVTGPGNSWAEQIAEAGDGKLIGVRTLNRLSDGEPTDPYAEHEWMFRPFRSKDAAAEGAHSIIAEAERIAHGPRLSAPKGSAAPVLLVEQDDERRRHALGKQLRRDADAVVMDIDHRHAELDAQPPYTKWTEGSHRDEAVNAEMWARLESDAQKALRSGKPVVVTGSKLTTDIAHRVGELLGRLIDAKPKQVRILPRDDSTVDRGDGFSNYGWPETRDTTKAARELSSYLLTSDDEPSLDDLLDMPDLFEGTPPKADRLRPVLADRLLSRSRFV